MGTNYYARIIPTKKRKQELIEAIENDDFDKVKSIVIEMYDSVDLHYIDGDAMLAGGEVHLGKRSSGWKFLWNPNIRFKPNMVFQDKNGTRNIVQDGYKTYKLYELTKQGIKSFIDREDVLIYDEYGELQDKDEFFEMALTWGFPDGIDGDEYADKYENARNHYETEYTKFLEKKGFTLNKYRTDFYSDGIRFATYTDFS